MNGPETSAQSRMERHPGFLRYLVILTAGAFLYFLIFFLCSRYPEFFGARASLLFPTADRYMDFFNLVFLARNFNPYAEAKTSASSPLFYLLCGILDKLVHGLSGSPQHIRFSLAGKTAFLVYVLTMLGFYLVAFHQIFRRFSVKHGHRCWFYAAFLLSYPVVFSIDRGNYSLLAGGVVALFLAQFMGGRTLSAAMLLAVAIALKYYYAPFVIIFIHRRKYRDAAACAVATIVIIVISLSLCQGGFLPNYRALVENLARYNSRGNGPVAESLGYNTSIYTPFDTAESMIHNWWNMGTEVFAELRGRVRYLAYSILAIVVLMNLVPCVRQHDRFLLLCSGIILFPVQSNDYIIPVIVFPSLYWILSEPLDRIMPWLAGLYIVCKRYVPLHYGNEGLSVTVQSFLNPVLLLSLVLYVLWIRRHKLLGSFERIMVKLLGVTNEHSKLGLPLMGGARSHGIPEEFRHRRAELAPMGSCACLPGERASPLQRRSHLR